jgi:hypothetical protein
LGKLALAQEELERAGAIFEHTNDPIGQANVHLTLLEELPLDINAAINNLARAAELTRNTHLAERFNNAALQLAIQILADNSQTYVDVDQRAGEIKAKLVSRALTKHGGANTRGAIARASEELGVTHAGLLWFLEQHKELGHKKRPQTHILAVPKQKKSA